MRRYGILIAFLSAMCCVGSSSRGPKLVVDLEGGADYFDIQAAIHVASDGDTVLVKPGECEITEPINFWGSRITVRSAGGPDVKTIRMSEAPLDPYWASVVVFENAEDSTSVLEGLTLTGGQGSITWEESATWGGGIYQGPRRFLFKYTPSRSVDGPDRTGP